MGSCVCLSKNVLSIENDEDVVSTVKRTPSLWVVINPRPSAARSTLSQQQDQLSNQVALSAKISCRTLSPTMARSPLTCLAVLESFSRKRDVFVTSLGMVQQKQEEVSSQDEVSLQVGSRASISNPLGSNENELTLVEDPNSNSFSHITPESAFSQGTAEFGEPDESSLCGTPQKSPGYLETAPQKCPNSSETLAVPCSILPRTETKKLFSPVYEKLRCSQRLPRKYWASEQESLLQKSPVTTAQQRQSLQ